MRSDWYDYREGWLLERYRPLPDIALRCHSKTARERVHDSRYG